MISTPMQAGGSLVPCGDLLVTRPKAPTSAAVHGTRAPFAAPLAVQLVAVLGADVAPPPRGAPV